MAADPYLTGLRPTEVGDGEAVFTLPCHEWLCSPLQTVEGGVIAMLADSGSCRRSRRRRRPVRPVAASI